MNIPQILMMLFLIRYIVPISGFPTQIHHLKLSAKVYAVPPWQGIRVGTLEKSQVSAINVTTKFPDGIVLISTDILSLDRDELVEKRIRENLSRGGTTLPWKGEIGLVTDYNLFKGQEFTLEGGSYRNQRKIMMGDLRGTDLKITFCPLESSGAELITKIRFEEARHSSLGGEIYMILIDRTFGIPLSRVYLIGFPSMKGGGGSTVYWIAILAVTEGFDDQ